jgi:hypothetical protein
MPFGSEEYVPPSIPDIGPVRTFEDVRSAIGKILEYLQRSQANDVQYFTHLRSNINQNATTQGPDLPATNPLLPSAFMHVVTGTGTITSITPPKNFVGQLMLVSRDGFMLASGGNISLFQTPNYLNPTAHIMLTWFPSMNMWFADTCRLKTTATTLNVSGHIVSEP